jgi:hypothetical protein
MLPKKPENPGNDGKPFVDDCGRSISVNVMTGLVRVDGIPVFRVIMSRDSEIRIQFTDSDKMRSRYRGTKFIEIPASVLFEKLATSCS